MFSDGHVTSYVFAGSDVGGGEGGGGGGGGGMIQRVFLDQLESKLLTQ